MEGKLAEDPGVTAQVSEQMEEQVNLKKNGCFRSYLQLNILYQGGPFIYIHS